MGDETFQRKWAALLDTAKLVVAALIDEGGNAVKEVAVRRRLQDAFGMNPNEADEAVRKAKLIFMNTDLVKLMPNIRSGDELAINPTWEYHLRRAIAALLATR